MNAIKARVTVISISLIAFSVALGEDDIQTIMNKGLKGVQSVEPIGKITTVWGRIKDH
jgi:hypothetical protein